MLVTTPVDFDDMPAGSLVSHFPYDHPTLVASIYCTGTTEGIGIGYHQTPGITVVPEVSVSLSDLALSHSNPNAIIFSSDVFTTPELQARGLGYILGSSLRLTCHNQHSTHFVTSGMAPAPHDYPSGMPPAQWSASCSNSSFSAIGIQIYYTFVKIGNASQHGTLPQNFTTAIATFYLANQSNPSQPKTVLPFSINITNFSSRVRQKTCATPLASNSTIHFGTISAAAASSQPAGTQLAVRNFTFTFNCPFGSYYNIGFWIEPVYGMVSGNSNSAGNYGSLPYALGTMGIASGVGMAKGIGVQLSISKSSFDYTPQVVAPAEAGYMRVLYGDTNPYNIYRVQALGNADPLLFDDTSVTRHFRARLIRLDEPLVAGQIKAAALIHIRYN